MKVTKERAGRVKKRKYDLEDENWGVDTIVEKEQENAPPAAPPAIQSEEQPSKEQRPANSRSMQAKMSEFWAPGKVKPALAGSGACNWWENFLYFFIASQLCLLAMVVFAQDFLSAMAVLAHPHNCLPRVSQKNKSCNDNFSNNLIPFYTCR